MLIQSSYQLSSTKFPCFFFYTFLIDSLNSTSRFIYFSLEFINCFLFLEVFCVYPGICRACVCTSVCVYKRQVDSEYLSLSLSICVCVNFSFIFYLCFMCLGILSAHMPVHYFCVVPIDTRDGIGSSGTRITDGCESAMWVLGIDLKSFGRASSVP